MKDSFELNEENTQAQFQPAEREGGSPDMMLDAYFYYLKNGSVSSKNHFALEELQQKLTEFLLGGLLQRDARVDALVKYAISDWYFFERMMSLDFEPYVRMQLLTFALPMISNNHLMQKIVSAIGEGNVSDEMPEEERFNNAILWHVIQNNKLSKEGEHKSGVQYWAALLLYVRSGGKNAVIEQLLSQCRRFSSVELWRFNKECQQLMFRVMDSLQAMSQLLDSEFALTFDREQLRACEPVNVVGSSGGASAIGGDERSALLSVSGMWASPQQKAQPNDSLNCESGAAVVLRQTKKDSLDGRTLSF